MKVSDLKPRMGKVDIELEIIDISEPREFQKFGNNGRVATATAKDDTGEIKVSLWNEDIDLVKKGSKIKITSGFVNEFQGEMQLSKGKYGGTLEVIS
ncbi:MAG: OB-fold nucleic acid binding domain-containing protein [Candidatus Nanoarchaeia archaeon]|nr:OB-fold nucleic acid binding domain-containing protein [Candidatus Nanoarchaeia archaeon]